MAEQEQVWEKRRQLVQDHAHLVALARMDQDLLATLSLLESQSTIEGADATPPSANRVVNNFPDQRKFLLKYCLARLLRCSIQEVSFGLSEFSKPNLSEQHRSNLRFNTSSRAGYMIIGIAAANEVGVDIETENECFERPDFLQNYLSQAELVKMNSVPTAFRPEAARAAWCAKEAFLKFEGCGFLKEPDSVELLSQWDAGTRLWELSCQSRWLDLPWPGVSGLLVSGDIQQVHYINLNLEFLEVST